MQVTNPFYKKLNWNNGIKMTIPETKITNSKVTINQDVEKTLVDISFNPMSGGINLYDNTPKGQSEPLYYSDEKDYLIYEEDGHSVHCVGSNNKLFFKAKEKKSFITFDYSSGLSTIEKTIQIVDEENEETDGVLQVQRSSLLNTNFGLLSLDLHYLGTSPYHIELKVIVDYGNGRTSQFSFSYHSSFRFISCPFTFLKGAVKSISFQLQSDVTLSFITGKMSSSEGIINVYDEEGKLYQQFDGANQRTYLYQKNGLPYRVYIKDQDGNETIKQYSFDENNQLKLELDSKGNYTEYFTDSESNETKVRSYSNKHLSLWSESETIQEKDNESMVQSDALFENVKTQSFYHPASQLLEKYIDERGQIYRYGYEPFKDYQAEISTIVNQSRIYNKFEYNFDLLTKISHPGTSFYYEYDEQERIRKVSVGNQELWSIEYSTPTKLSDNIIITKTNNKNEKIITHYSQDGYLQYTQSLTYNYDSQHNVTSIYNEFEHYNFSYDENNRIIKQENSVSNYYSNSEEYIYDEDKLVKTIFKDLKKNTEKVFTYEYDENNHLTNVGFNSNQFDLALDDQNRISKETFTIPNKLSMIKEYSYVSGKQTELPLVHSSCTTINDTLIFNHSYLYDASQNITSNQDELGITRYHYDGINRLVREDNHHFGKSFQYEYDQAGNVLSKKEFDYTLEDTLVHPTAVYTYAYQNENWKDQLSAIYKNGHIQFKNVYDSMGNPTSYKGNTLVWNKDLITKYNTMQFEYDGNRKLIKTTYNNVGTYYHITDNKIQQMNIGNNILMFYYVLDKLVQFSYNNIVYTYLTNEWNDITHILDENGNVVASYVYDAWGNHQVYDADGIENKDSTFIGNINPFRYRGYLYFKEIQLYFLSSRFYDPDTGRFLSPDSYSFLNPNVIHGLNLYAYCFNNPVMYADPSGHIPKWLAWLVSGAAIVGGILLSATGIGGVLGGVLIGAGAGSLINGYVTEANGGDFTAGYIGGVISGALCGLGAGLGGMAFAAASEATNFACIGYMALGVTTSFVGGFAGNLAGTVYTSWHNSGFTNVDINWEETLMTSLIMGSLNIFAGMGAAMSSIAGSMARVATDLNSKLALRILAGIIAGGTEAAYDLVSYLIGTLISTF